MTTEAKTMGELIAALDVTTGILLREAQPDIEQALVLSAADDEMEALTIGCSMKIKQVGVNQYSYDVALSFTKEKKKTSKAGYVGTGGSK